MIKVMHLGSGDMSDGIGQVEFYLLTSTDGNHNVAVYQAKDGDVARVCLCKLFQGYSPQDFHGCTTPAHVYDKLARRLWYSEPIKRLVENEQGRYPGNIGEEIEGQLHFKARWDYRMKNDELQRKTSVAEELKRQLLELEEKRRVIADGLDEAERKVKDLEAGLGQKPQCTFPNLANLVPSQG